MTIFESHPFWGFHHERSFWSKYGATAAFGFDRPHGALRGDAGPRPTLLTCGGDRRHQVRTRRYRVSPQIVFTLANFAAQPVFHRRRRQHWFADSIGVEDMPSISKRTRLLGTHVATFAVDVISGCAVAASFSCHDQVHTAAAYSLRCTRRR